MAKISKVQLKKWFQNFLKPTQEQFWNWMDSYWHKDEKIPVGSISGLDELLGDDINLENYLLKDGNNLDNSSRELLREKLGVGDVPNNIGLVDTEGTEGNVYTKEQVDEFHKPIKISNDTIVHFRQEVDYGTVSQPLSSITLDLEGAKRNVIQCIYYNSQELPSGINWINNADDMFQANTTFLMILKYENDSRLIGNLMFV